MDQKDGLLREIEARAESEYSVGWLQNDTDLEAFTITRANER